MSKARSTTAPASGEAAVAARAYALWEAQGRPDGHDLDHWLQAEQEVTVEPVPPRPGRRTAAAKAA